MLAKYCHHSIKVFEVHLKGKLKEQLAKDPPEIIPCSQDCVENRMFSGTASSCIFKISDSETVAKREFTPAILFLFGLRIIHPVGVNNAH